VSENILEHLGYEVQRGKSVNHEVHEGALREKGLMVEEWEINKTGGSELEVHEKAEPVAQMERVRVIRKLGFSQQVLSCPIKYLNDYNCLLILERIHPIIIIKRPLSTHQRVLQHGQAIS